MLFTANKLQLPWPQVTAAIMLPGARISLGTPDKSAQTATEDPGLFSNTSANRFHVSPGRIRLTALRIPSRYVNIYFMAGYAGRQPAD